jgi:hypothetical protein
MEKTDYTLEDLEEITGLSRRTLQNYIGMGILKGSLEGGKRIFARSQAETFLNDPYLWLALGAKQNGLIADFLSSQPAKPAICSVVSLPMEDSSEANGLSRRICAFLAEKPQRVSFNFRYEAKKKASVIVLVGGIPQVQSVLKFIQG